MMIDQAHNRPRTSGHTVRAGRAVRRFVARGFSIVELSVVMVIIAVLAGVAVPRFAGAIARSRADSAAARLAADLELTRVRARTTSRTREVLFPKRADGYVLQGEPTATTSGAAYIVNLNAAPYHATVGDVLQGGNAVTTVRFDGYGTVEEGATIDLNVGTQRRRVTIDAGTGRASVAVLP